MSVRRRGLAAALLATLLAGCGGGGASAAPSARPVTLTVYAAASLKAALAEVVASYAGAHPEITLVVSTDSSAALETKIEQGAPADVFLSADARNPQKLADASLAVGPVVPFARNRLALIVPAADPAGIATPADLARTGVKVVAAADSVPIAGYTATLLANLAAAPGYPAGYAGLVGANVVSREDNVGGIVTKVALGEGDAGVVYATDAVAAGAKVRTVAIPDSANVVATYGGVVVKASRAREAAAAFLAWIAGPGGQAVLGPLGFLPPA